MRHHRFIAIMGLTIVFAAGTVRGSDYQFEFLFDPSASGLNASLALSAATGGTLIGNYDPTNNPSGTRTKPGLFGPFGSTENVAVPAALTLGVGGQPNSSTSGSFRLTADTATNTAWLDVLLANLLNSGPLTTSATITIEYDSFRTRNPTSVYPGGIPIELPLGEAQVTSMTLTQQGGPVAGILTPIDRSDYQFAFLVPAVLSVTATFMGTPLTVPDTVVAMPFAGELAVNGDTAQIISVQPFQFSNTSNPGTTLPQFAMDVPTIVPPGNTASLLFDLTLNEVSSGVDGTLTTVANGTLIPEPAGLVLLVTGAALGLRRRRRS